MTKPTVVTSGHVSGPDTEYDSLDTNEPYQVGPVYCGKVQRGSLAEAILKMHGYTDEMIFGGTEQ